MVLMLSHFFKSSNWKQDREDLDFMKKMMKKKSFVFLRTYLCPKILSGLVFFDNMVKRNNKNA